MSSPFRRLARQSSVYAVGNAFAKASGVLIVPLYLRLLTTADVGYLGLLVATAQIAIPLAGFGLTTGLLTFSADPARADRHAALPFTVLVASAAMAFVAFGTFWAASAPLASLLLDGAERAPLVRMLGAYAALKVLQATPLMLLRIDEKAGRYVLASVLETVVLAAATYVAMVPLGLGVEGALWGLMLSAGASTAALLALTLGRVAWRLDGGLVRELVRFGLPLVLSALALPVIHVGDRYVLKALAGPAEVGVYDLAARLSGLLNVLVVQSFQQAFAVVGMKALADAGAAPFYRRTVRLYTALTGWAALALALGTYDATVLLAGDGAYAGAEPMVLPLALGFLAYGLYIVFANTLYAAGDTRTVAATLVAAVAVNLGLNVLFVPALGGVGAALATLVAYAMMAALTAAAAERRRPLGYPWRAVAIVGAVVAGLWATAQAIPTPTLLGRVLVRGVAVTAYPALIVALGVYSRDEVRALVARLRARRREHDGSTTDEAP